MNTRKLNHRISGGRFCAALGVALIGFSISGCDSPTTTAPTTTNDAVVAPGDSPAPGQTPGEHIRTGGGTAVDVNPPGGGVHVDVPPGPVGNGTHIDVGPDGVRVAPK